MCNMKTYLKGCISCRFILVKLQVMHNDLWVNFPFHLLWNDFWYTHRMFPRQFTVPLDIPILFLKNGWVQLKHIKIMYNNLCISLHYIFFPKHHTTANDWTLSWHTTSTASVWWPHGPTQAALSKTEGLVSHWVRKITGFVPHGYLCKGLKMHCVCLSKSTVHYKVIWHCQIQMCGRSYMDFEHSPLTLWNYH